MKLILTLVFIASTSASQLTNLYLPANVASSSANTIATFNAPSRETFTTEAPAASTNSTPTPSPIVSLASASTPVLYGVPLVRNYAAAPPIAILRNGLYSDSRGAYSFEYETANHIIAQESGKIKAPDSSEVQGSYSYLAPNGQIISLSYVANENGFQPTGDHLPTPPPTPEAILKSLELNAAEEARGVVNDGQYLPPSAELVVSKQIVAPSVPTQYLPPAVNPATVLWQRVVPSIAAQRIVTPTSQYIPAVRSDNVVSIQNVSPSSLNLGYKY